MIVDRRPDGTILVRSAQELGTYPARMTDPLDYWAHHASYRTFLAERDAHGRWRNITYAETQFFARRIAQALIQRGLSVERPLVILSGNDVEHALLGIAAMYAGIPYAPLPTSYSLESNDFADLRSIFELLKPGLVYAANGAKFKQALDAVMPPPAEIVVNENPLPGVTMLSDLVNTEPEAALDQAHSRVHANTVFKILFTARPGEAPKGVINTHRMWTSNQEMARHSFAFLKEEPPILVDSLPWSQSIGGNGDLGLVLYNGGSLYIDHDEGIRNLRVMAPTMHFSTPEKLEGLAPHLRNDTVFRKHFFSRMKLVYCAGAGLSQQTWNELAELSFQETGGKSLMYTGLSSAETGPYALFGLPGSTRPNLVGGPAPGMELKLVPAGSGRFEACVRGPNVTWGYWRRLDLTRESIDEEGFFKLGSCLRFEDEANPARGFVCEGPVASGDV